MRHSLVLLTFAALAACKGEATPTDVVDVDCVNDETSVDISTVQAPDWPAGLSDVIDDYRALDGRWTADACGTPIRVSLRTNQVIDTTVQIVTTPLPENNTCGCTHDPDFPNDGTLDIVARTTLDFSVQDYPEEGFREESAGNVEGLPIAIYADGSGLDLRGCSVELVPPVLLLEYRDTEVTFRMENGSPSGTISLVGPDVSPATCELTDWTRVGDN